MAPPSFPLASDPFCRRRPSGMPIPLETFLPTGYERFDSGSCGRVDLLIRSCAKRGMTGKQVHRMMVAISARLFGIHPIS